MKLAPPRLLPIVIAATAALLLFKGVGIVTQGGYVLVGTTQAVAAGGGASSPPPAEGGATDMTDESPTLEDNAVTLQLPGATPGAEAEHADASTGPDIGPAAAELPEACPPTDAAAAESGTAPTPPDPSVTAPCAPDPGVNEYGDALPLITDNASGQLVPLADVLKDASSENAINQRLADRRAELEQRERELEMRATLIDAAEKRIEERSAELKALEAKITKLVDDNKTAEQQQFVSLVAMYENMRPKEAATIFNQLDMPVLLGVAKAMNPRKMAPILARMDPLKAKELTDAIAADEVPAPTVTAAAPEDLTNLPQIVGE